MVKIYQLTFCIVMIIMMQSCYIKQRPNMNFVDRADAGQQADIVSIKVPMFLVKPFLRKELQEEDDEMLRLAMRKIKSVKLMTLSNASNNARIQENYKQFLRDEHMEEYASIISDGDRVTINAQTKKDKIRKLMLGVSSEDGEHVFIEVKGNFSVADIAHALDSYEKKNK
ncbi:DUF4252 domain-containing protein [Sphingobacterium griseoflavum]|uniref:DUF4252 domain-containing protein n=1 Tax=Sphingobacterium griseoflavum TaxID=1474952 RepID=A0ABQ3HUH4_9SPHI|nr:DUF4252 domain-containing protein [Sphingobacterium griseoflavum]GHE23038.1 hypothetical protein GCM10017764_00060 [Sphingobacterium griseoflavum]